MMHRKRKKETIGKWRPISEYDESLHDWALVRFTELKTGFTGLPMVASRRPDGTWNILACEDWALDYYINTDCVATEFMLWEGGEQ